jgi:hypothetical protein
VTFSNNELYRLVIDHDQHLPASWKAMKKCDLCGIWIHNAHVRWEAWNCDAEHVTTIPYHMSLSPKYYCNDCHDKHYSI